MDDIKLLECAIEKQPKGALARIAQAIGPAPAALLMRALAGQNIYMPSKRTLFLLSLPAIVQEETARLVGKDKKLVFKQISRIYNVPVWKLKRRMRG